MSTSVIPFAGNKLPAYLQNVKADLASYQANVGGGFGVLSIKGGRFALIKDGVRNILFNPDNPEAPASHLELVFLKANPRLSKIFYLKGYVEGSTEKPDCSSANGVNPDPGVPAPHFEACATCPNNFWGTGNGGKGKACQDNRRIAVAALTNLDEPLLLRVPPASLKALASYAKWLADRNVPAMNTVVTQVGFDLAEATPHLVFKAVSFLNDDTYTEAVAVAESETVGQIIGTLNIPEETEAAPAIKGTPPKIKPEAVAKAVAQPAVVEDDEDDEEAAPVAPAPKPKAAPKPAPKPAPAPKAAGGEDLEALNAALDDLLNQYDG